MPTNHNLLYFTKTNAMPSSPGSKQPTVANSFNSRNRKLVKKQFFNEDINLKTNVSNKKKFQKALSFKKTKTGTGMFDGFLINNSQKNLQSRIFPAL